ncbi:MAG: hypothetical protein JSW56_18100 [Deltaproteobacteria bacterium]|nr:MAG: hypothetical protein JSW56_18100 [Deltaproteobacteria bacterium]
MKKKVILLEAALMIALPMSAQAIQPDASYLSAQERNQQKWAAEDKQIGKKLAALEKRFGEKP